MNDVQNVNQNIALTNKAAKVEYNKIQKVSNFFRGDNTNNSKQPKKLSYDIKEIFYTSRIKENEYEPKLLLEKLPAVFRFENTHNSNDSKTTTKTKNSSNDQKNNYNKLSINNSNEVSPDYKRYKNDRPKKRSENKKYNNFFIEEEINIQNQLQNKTYNNKNNKNNKDIIPLKIFTKTNNDNCNYKQKSSTTDYNKSIFTYNNNNIKNNNNNNNNHLKTDFSEYENLRPKKNNLIDLGYHNFPQQFNLKNTNFNKSLGEKFRYSEKIRQTTFNVRGNNIKNIYNEVLNTSELCKNRNIRKSSDSDVYPTKLNYIEKNIMKKNERSGSYMNMVNYQDFLQLDPYGYSPNATTTTNNNININTMTNNNLSSDSKTIKDEEMRLSAKPLLHPIIPNRKNSKEKEKMRVSRYINNNIRNIKNTSKISKMSIITENIFNEMNFDKKNIIKNININKNNYKISIDNINEGITFKYNNGFKYYFNLTYGNIFFLKEVQYNLAKGISTSIKSWNKIFNDNNNYLKIISRLLNTPENHFTFIIEYPRDSENINDIVNSVGLNDPRLIYFIVSEIYKNILILKHEQNEIIKDNKNISFCLCDLFLTAKEELKIMPPVIRKIPINASKSFNDNNNNNNKTKKDNNNGYICDCKKNIELLIQLFNIPTNNIAFFSLGLCILQLVTQNFLFKLKSYNLLIKEKNNNKYCCFIHSLLHIEENNCNCNKKKDLLLKNFLSQYNNKLINFIHQCMNNEEIKNYPNSDFIDCYDMMEKKIDLSMKELLSIINFNDNNYISLDNFLKNFKLLFGEMEIQKNDFKSLLHENKVINVIKRSFNVDKKELKDIIYKIIDNEDNEKNSELYDKDDFYQNENYANSGNCFYNDSCFSKIIDNNNNTNININNINKSKIRTIINDKNIDNKINNFHYNKNHVIFKNYNHSENNS